MAIRQASILVCMLVSRIGTPLTNMLRLMMVLPLVMGMAGWPFSAKSRCERGIDTAYEELKEAKAGTVISGLKLTQAAGFLAQAKVRQQLENYDACVQKVNRARDLIAAARK